MFVKAKHAIILQGTIKIQSSNSLPPLSSKSSPTTFKKKKKKQAEREYQTQTNESNQTLSIKAKQMNQISEENLTRTGPIRTPRGTRHPPPPPIQFQAKTPIRDVMKCDSRPSGASNNTRKSGELADSWIS